MKTIRNLLFLFFYVFATLVAYSQDGVVTLPYFCGFENASDTVGTYGWKFVKRTAEHSFVVGEAVSYMGDKAMYVSKDDGLTASYAASKSTQGSVVVAYKTFYLKAGTYDLMFDYRMQGGFLQSGDVVVNSDVMRVAFCDVADISGKPTAVATGEFPKYAKEYPFKDKDGVETFTSSVWKQVSGQLKIESEGYYYLVFLFKEDGNEYVYNPGACIDNVQLDVAKSLTNCAVAPSNIQVNKETFGVKLTWNGNADMYDLVYECLSSEGNAAKEVRAIAAKEYFFSYADLEEGIYDFRIRARCATDSSLWVVKPNVIVYDESKHCLNYMDFYAPGTSCYYGNFENPAVVKRVYDYGYESRNSIHTLHYVQDEYDRLTGYQLKTVPQGEIASVRLGNWTEGEHGDSPIPSTQHKGGSPSGRIEYTYTIPGDKTVLLLHYAAVLQYASNHDAEKQTRILVEILDSKGQLLECASADFNAKDVDNGNTRGWHTYLPETGEVIDGKCPIKWLDWSVLGMNLEPYVGETVKIRLTLSACEADYHFAYGYFVLDCTEGEVGGMSCTEKADTLFVPEGFDYLWYVQGDKTKTAVSRDRMFVPAEDDMTSYAVDLIYPEDPKGCYFTLYATVWPRIPLLDVDFKRNPQNCVNYLDVVNHSKMIDLKMDREGNVIDTLDVDSNYIKIKNYYWEIKSTKGTLFENGRTISSEINPRIVVPEEGDTFVIVVKAMYNSCESVEEYSLTIPELQAAVYSEKRYVCDGKEVEFNGKTYTEPGVYIDTLKSVYGCDSILQLTLETLVTDTIRMDSVICSATAPFKWFDKSLDSTGVYEHNIVSSMGCDSLYYILDLTILESLVLDIDLPVEICEDDDVFEIGYEAKSGDVSGYNIECADLNIAEEVLFDEDSVVGLVIDLPEEVKPNRYELDITFYNSDCGDLDTTLVIDVLYSKDVIAQRWNDVLALKNSTYNGGYEFIAYQWFLNGNPLDGFIGSQFYEAGKDLDFDGEYSVLLTRKEDGVSMMTCTFVPTQFSDSDLSNVGKLVFTNEIVSVESKQEAKCYIYNLSGLLYAVVDLGVGENTITMPSREGIYLMVFDYIDREKEAIKIVVRN